MQQVASAGLIMSTQRQGTIAAECGAKVPLATWWRTMRCDTPRSRRVLVMVLGIIVLSLADLIITLAYLKANWMMEANPLAAWIIRNTHSPLALALFKIGSVGVCAALLYRLRHHRSGEAASWCAMGVLTLMSLMWRDYASHFDNPEVIMGQMALICDDARLGVP